MYAMYAMYDGNFKKNKTEVQNFLRLEERVRKEGIKYVNNSDKGIVEDILDENIVNLIHILNKLPFLYTMGCCGGHAGRYKETCYSSAWFTFTVDDNNKKSSLFLKGLYALIENYEYTLLERQETAGPFSYAVVLRQSLDDLTQEKMKCVIQKVEERIQHLTAFVETF